MKQIHKTYERNILVYSQLRERNIGVGKYSQCCEKATKFFIQLQTSIMFADWYV